MLKEKKRGGMLWLIIEPISPLSCHLFIYFCLEKYGRDGQKMVWGMSHSLYKKGKKKRALDANSIMN